MIKINHETNIKEIKEFIKIQDLDKDLIKWLDDFINSKASNHIERAKQSGHMRTFLISLIKEISKKIAENKKEKIPKVENGSSDAKYKSYLKKIKLLSKNESSYLNILYSVLSEASGNHNLTTDSKKYRFMIITSLEMALLILSRAKTFLPKEGVVKNTIPAITEEQFRRLMEHTKEKRHKIGFLLAFTGGMETSEVVKLKPSNINLEEKTISINIKNRLKNRTVPLSVSFKKEHMTYIPLPCQQRALQKAFVASAEKSGIIKESPYLQFRSLRKGFALQLHIQKREFSEFKELMGLEPASAIELKEELEAQMKQSLSGIEI